MPVLTRPLTFKQNGRDVAVAISIDASERGEHDWSCRYSIDWSNGLHCRTGFGLDATQALLLTMEAIGTDIDTSEFHGSVRLRWLQPGDGYGFSVRSTIRDLLIGGDAAHAGLPPR